MNVTLHQEHWMHKSEHKILNQSICLAGRSSVSRHSAKQTEASIYCRLSATTISSVDWISDNNDLLLLCPSGVDRG